MAQELNNFRISKSASRTMLIVAALFDLLAIFALIVTFILFVVLVLKSDLAQDVKTATDQVDVLQQEGSEYFVLGSGGIIGGSVAAAATKVVLSGTAFIFIAPIIYTIFSFMSTVVAYALFTFWFMSKGVYMWSFGSAERVAVNIGSMVVENIPIFNLLPGITFMVWRHIKVSQKEDRIKTKDQSREIARQLERAELAAYA